MKKGKRVFIMVEVEPEERERAKELARLKYTDMSKMIRDMLRRAADRAGI